VLLRGSRATHTQIVQGLTFTSLSLNSRINNKDCAENEREVTAARKSVLDNKFLLSFPFMARLNVQGILAMGKEMPLRGKGTY
jgi:ABC-type hemin transport system ATPase subunit